MRIERRYDVRSIANFVLDYADKIRKPISNMAANKLVYFLIEHSLLERDIVLTEARIEAWEHGPVFRELYSAFRQFGDKPIKGRAAAFDAETRAMVLAPDIPDMKDREFFTSVLERYINLSASHLRAISHLDGCAWRRVWAESENGNPGMQITIEHIVDTCRKGMVN